MSDLWPDIEPVSDSSDDGSINEGSKDQENPDDQKHKKVVSITYMNLMSLRRGNQRALRLIKINIEKSKDKLFFNITFKQY